MTLEFVLSQTDGRLMYLQIMEQIKNRITSGDWSQGFKLPSIRERAVSTKISVIPVKRAYQEREVLAGSIGMSTEQLQKRLAKLQVNNKAYNTQSEKNYV